MASVLTDPRQKAVYMAPVSKQPRHKTRSMASADNRGQKVTFWPRPNMPRFQTRGKMRKITGAKSPYCTGGVGIELDFFHSVALPLIIYKLCSIF